jgi:hypothetical protein
LCYDKSDASEREGQEHGAEEIYGMGIALLNCVKDCAIPDIDSILEADISDD